MLKPFACLFVAFMLNHARVPGQEREVIQENRIYKTIDGTGLGVDIFYTADREVGPAHTAIAFFHGGGWAYGSPSEFHTTCTRYARKGFVTFSFQYRLSIDQQGNVPHPEITPVESVKDARSALRWLRENAASFHVDPEKIVAAGQSAGGQLALSTVLMDHVNEATDHLEISTVPAAILLFSSNVNTMEAWVDRLLGDRREEIWSISPHHNLKSGLPPIIEFHGEEDCMVPIWIVRHFMERARQLGNNIEFVALEGRSHYLGEGDDTYATYYDEGIMESTDAFLVRHGFMDP